MKRILTYVDQRSPSGARNVRQAIRTVAGLIAAFPEIGRPSDETETRVIPVGTDPYLLYWTIVREVPTIVHVRHAARRQV